MDRLATNLNAPNDLSSARMIDDCRDSACYRYDPAPVRAVGNVAREKHVTGHDAV